MPVSKCSLIFHLSFRKVSRSFFFIIIIPLSSSSSSSSASSLFTEVIGWAELGLYWSNYISVWYPPSLIHFKLIGRIVFIICRLNPPFSSVSVLPGVWFQSEQSSTVIHSHSNQIFKLKFGFNRWKCPSSATDRPKWIHFLIGWGNCWFHPPVDPRLHLNPSDGFRWREKLTPLTLIHSGSLRR